MTPRCLAVFFVVGACTGSQHDRAPARPTAAVTIPARPTTAATNAPRTVVLEPNVERAIAGTPFHATLLVLRPAKPGINLRGNCIPPVAAGAALALRHDGVVERVSWTEGSHRLFGVEWHLKLRDGVAIMVRPIARSRR